ncbi:NUDIX domain-containing protein [Patescibacteria group bacterium]|nr:NUDIX domain-containing protein [Patescibacteria group bacterium]MBU1721949.1 NUDIX domain-containing protein [Patescibacteria group bacterium]MBU1901770.1 NUDIX domain-containing protein [Patescibacteria group bacterium]
MKNQFTIGCFAIILNEKEEILIVHRNDYDLWNLPGGGMDIGETPEECVIREIKEETGFKAELIKLQGIYTKKDKNTISFSFICNIIGGKATLNDEARAIEFVSLKDIPKNFSPNQKERIEDYFQDRNHTIYKQQKNASSLELLKELGL